MMMINENVKYVLNLLTINHYEAYIVGGAVRDYLLGININDYDITTNAHPDEIQRVFNKHQSFTHGIKHGTVGVMINDEIIEITTYRVDLNYNDHRRPNKVIYTASLKEDLARRDFTINALAYYDKIIDYFGGVNDLNNKIIRCVNDPYVRFEEDALRILRALRFASCLGFKIENRTKNAMFSKKNNLLSISKERINQEFSKMIIGKNFNQIFREYNEIFLIIIPELSLLNGVNQNNKYHCYNLLDHTLETLSNVEPDLILKLSALFHDIGKSKTKTTDYKGVDHFYNHNIESVKVIKEVLKSLKYSNEVINEVSTIVFYHNYELKEDSKIIKKLLNKVGYSDALKIIKLKDADNKAHHINYRIDNYDTIKEMIINYKNKQECISIRDLKINGYDLINLGLKGQIIKKILNEVLNLVLDEKIKNEKEELLNYIRTKYITV